MTTDKRRIFLEHFLGLYEVDKIEITELDEEKICGIAIYLNDVDTQEFCWHITEDDVPSNDLIELIQIIRKNEFNKIDKLIVSAEELFEKTEWTDRSKFDKTFEELFEVEVKMIDDGEETDSFFIHD